MLASGIGEAVGHCAERLDHRLRLAVRVGCPRPSHDAHDPRLQPTDGQEIEVLIVSRDEAATAYGNLDGGSGGVGRSGDGAQAGTAEEEADDGTSEANSLGCASQQDSRKGARRGREEASKVAGPDREGASKAQATEEGLARQVDKSSTGRSPGAAYRRPCLWQRRWSHRGRVDACFASGDPSCFVSFATTCRGKAGH